MMNIWNRIKSAMKKGVTTSMPLPNANSNIGRSNPQPIGNRVSVSNAQSWNPETHPEGRGPSHLVQDFDYDDGKLTVTYRDGFSAEYNNISPEQAKDFARADSKGRWALKNLWEKPYKEV